MQAASRCWGCSLNIPPGFGPQLAANPCHPRACPEDPAIHSPKQVKRWMVGTPGTSPSASKPVHDNVGRERIHHANGSG
jgi:hypothetical protein